MLELKEYQRRAITAFDQWLKALDEAARESRNGSDERLNVRGDVPRNAWKRLAERGWGPAGAPEYRDRRDGAGRPIPHACIRLPNGGDSTLLGAVALDRLGMSPGLTLWIVPSRAIYAKTVKAFKTRGHPYRELLERASGDRVKILEKDDHFGVDDLRNYLCVMMLMVPVADRTQDEEFLRIYRDSGRYLDLFPREDDDSALEALLRKTPDLDRHSGGGVKQNLYNVLKLQRPVVVLDEAHRAYGSPGADEFLAALNGFNPRLVVEFSATHNPGISNLLVDIADGEI